MSAVGDVASRPLGALRPGLVFPSGRKGAELPGARSKSIVREGALALSGIIPEIRELRRDGSYEPASAPPDWMGGGGEWGGGLIDRSVVLLTRR